MFTGTANETRRAVMVKAWGFKRGQQARPFGECLRDAWRMVKHAARMAVRPALGGRVAVTTLAGTRKPVRTFASFQAGEWGRGAGDNRMLSRLGR